VLRQVLAPIHPDGWRFIAIFVVAAAILCVLWHPLGWVGLIAILWCIYFFRDPWRVTPVRPGLVIAPADGLVVSVDRARPPPELGMGPEPMLRVGIFLSVLDVHMNRMPMAGRIRQRIYTKGRFVNAGHDKASPDNERMALRIATPEGVDIAVVQIAGLIARRIVCTVSEGQEVIAGQRYGLIRFGSRAEVYFPAAWSHLVMVGQHAIGGETVLADARLSEPPRQGTEH
jgi:phosphatidylserine decarboxylase